MIFEKIVKILVDYKGNDDITITKDTSFEELGLDSLDTVEIIMKLEEEFDLEIQFDENVKTVGDVAELIEKLTA